MLLTKRPDHVWMIDFTKVGGVVRPLCVGAVRGAPTSAFAVRLLSEAIRRNRAPRWLVTDKDPVLLAGLVQRLLTAHGMLRRYGAVDRRGSMALIERTWRSMKQEVRATPLPAPPDPCAGGEAPVLAEMAQRAQAARGTGAAYARRRLPRATTT